MNLRLHPEIVGQERRPGQLIGDHDPRRVRAILHQRPAQDAVYYWRQKRYFRSVQTAWKKSFQEIFFPSSKLRPWYRIGTS